MIHLLNTAWFYPRWFIRVLFPQHTDYLWYNSHSSYTAAAISALSSHWLSQRSRTEVCSCSRLNSTRHIPSTLAIIVAVLLYLYGYLYGYYHVYTPCGSSLWHGHISHGSAMAIPLRLYGKFSRSRPGGSSYSVPAHDSTQHDTFHPPWQSSWLFCCICMVTITSTLPVALLPVASTHLTWLSDGDTSAAVWKVLTLTPWHRVFSPVPVLLWWLIVFCSVLYMCSVLFDHSIMKMAHWQCCGCSVVHNVNASCLPWQPVSHRVHLHPGLPYIKCSKHGGSMTYGMASWFHGVHVEC
jgi:hypothetical protein